jgi:hypothetical protein
MAWHPTGAERPVNDLPGSGAIAGPPKRHEPVRRRPATRKASHSAPSLRNLLRQTAQSDPIGGRPVYAAGDSADPGGTPVMIDETFAAPAGAPAPGPARAPRVARPSSVALLRSPLVRDEVFYAVRRRLEHDAPRRESHVVVLVTDDLEVRVGPAVHDLRAHAFREARAAPRAGTRAVYVASVFTREDLIVLWAGPQTVAATERCLPRL